MWGGAALPGKGAQAMIQYAKSEYEETLDRELLEKTSGKARRALEVLLADKALEELMGFCNIVSVERYGFNDHGRVHAKIATLNALTILDLLEEAGVEPNVVKENIGDSDDAHVIVVTAAFLHDLGMSIGRQDHEFNSPKVGDPFIFKVLRALYEEEGKVYILRSYIFEAIMGHMAHLKVNSIESGIVLVSDGCDMEYGRARAAIKRRQKPVVGDIHAYSALSVTRVELRRGENKPLEIFIQMKDATGIFQVEEVLMGKIAMSSIKPYIELSVQIADEPKMYYLR
jgi:metal-dependent HD superfamily phosphatase/phosphodiesterase